VKSFGSFSAKLSGVGTGRAAAAQRTTCAKSDLQHIAA
jgi:hypothetical protein